MRHRVLRFLALIAGLSLALACQSDRVLKPVDEYPDPHSALDAIAVRVQVDLTTGEVHVLPPTAMTRDSGGPSLAILGTNEVGVTTSNLVRSAPVNNKVTVTFDAAITNRLTSSSLVPSTFPGTTGGGGLMLFPFKVTQITGGTAGQVVASNDWDGDGTPGSGAPRNFFNDFGCPNGGITSDCYRWELYPAPLGPGETSAARKVGFTVPKAVTTFTVLLVLAADVSNDLPAVARLSVTPPSYVMNDGFPANFSAVAYDIANNPLPWATIKWTSPDATALEFQYGSALVGTITGPSVVVHGRKVGQISFTVSSGGVSVLVPVDIQVNTIVLVQPYILPDSNLVPGEQVQAFASVKDNSGNIVPGFNPTWSTSDPNVATVNPQTGLITAVGPGMCNIIATAAGAAGMIPITVGAPTTGNITGTVTDLDGQPVPGVSVHALGLSDLTVTTDAQGEYSFGGVLQPGIYVLDFTRSNCVTGNARSSAPRGNTNIADIALNCPPRVRGTVTATQGTLPTGLTVELAPELGGSHKLGVVQSDGSYSVVVFTDGAYFIFLSQLPGNCTASTAQPLNLSQQSDVVQDWTVDCGPVGAIAGSVVDLDGSPVAGATIQAQSFSPPGPLLSTTSDVAGAFGFDLLPPGGYSVGAGKPGTSCGQDFGLPLITAGQTITIPFVLDCPFQLSGHVPVLGTFPGSFPAGMTIQVFGVDASFQPFRQFASVLADGSYSASLPTSFDAANGGSFAVEIFGSPNSCDSQIYDVVSRQQGSATNFDVPLDCRTAAVRIIVNDGGLNSNPQPLIGVPVDVAFTNITALTDQTGIASFPSLPAGFTVFSAVTCDLASTELFLAHGAAYTQTIALSCSGAGALEGTITTALGTPLFNIQVAVGPYTVTTNANGHWGVGGLSPGPTFVTRITTPAGCSGSVPIQVAVIATATQQVNETVNCNGF